MPTCVAAQSKTYMLFRLYIYTLAFKLLQSELHPNPSSHSIGTNIYFACMFALTKRLGGLKCREVDDAVDTNDIHARVGSITHGYTVMQSTITDRTCTYTVYLYKEI